MRKLALSDEILMQIEKPARYIGNELNSVVKDDTSQIRFAMCFPDVYEIGMSHLGIQILYDMFNRREDTWCERVYSPWPDLHKIMKEQNIPLFGLESQEPIKNFDFVGLTLQYEMCYTNILQILDLAQIPLLSADRGDEDPIILGGGPCSYNPEPIADFFDCFYIGEGETQYDTFLNLYKSMRASGQYSRKAFLHEAAKIEGIYVPSLYEVRYKEDGTIAAFTPVYDDIPAVFSNGNCVKTVRIFCFRDRFSKEFCATILKEGRKCQIRSKRRLQDGHFGNQRFEKTVWHGGDRRARAGGGKPVGGKRRICRSGRNLRIGKIDAFTYAWRTRPGNIRQSLCGRQRYICIKG